jgi:hypothetical protein
MMMDIAPSLYHGESQRGRTAWRLAALAGILAALLSRCGGEGPAPAQIVTAEGSTSARTVLEAALDRLPDVPGARQQILFGDLARLRAAYAGDGGDEALAGLWLPDALAGATRPRWRKTYGFGIRAVDRFAAAGFHPEETAVLIGRFRPAVIRATLGAHGWTRQGGMLSRGDDGSVDAGSATGPLALSSLNRIAVTPGRIVAASTTELARAALAPRATLADDPDISLVAAAVGEVTAAAILPAELVRPASGVVVAPIAASPALLVGVAVDDRGADGRVLRIALVYEEPAEAESDAAAIGGSLATTEVPTQEGQVFGDLLVGIEASAVLERVVLVEATLAADQLTGIWRGLLESGDLAVLVRQR